MANATDLTDDENWTGGSYDLTMRLVTPTDESLQSGLETLWKLAPIDGCWAVVSRDPTEVRPVETMMHELRAHVLLRGIVNAPGLGAVVCGVGLQEFVDGGSWLHLGLPLGVMVRLYPRIGAFPFGGDGGPKSLEWRLPIDSWLADLAMRIDATIPIEVAVIGFDAPEVGDYESGTEPSFYGLVERIDGQLHYEPARS